MKKIMFLLLSLLLLIGCASKNQNDTAPDEIVEDIEKEVEKPIFYSKFDGSEIDSQDDDNKRIFAVMFDNAPQARWQAGVSKAAIMYEIRVEASATRYFGIFNTSENIELGPVRSARPYHVHLAAMYGAVYAHHGAMQEVLNLMPQFGVENINGMAYDGSTYQRQNHKYAPHNSYTTIDRLNERADKLGYRSDNDFEGFNFFTTPSSINGSPATYIYLGYGSSYSTEYKYDATSKTYDRYKAGDLSYDENNDEKISATNIIIRLVDYTIANNGVHKQFYNTGVGSGFLISRGEVIDIKWSKDSNTSNTDYTTIDDKPITLNPGQTWIQWIENSAAIEISE